MFINSNTDSDTLSYLLKSMSPTTIKKAIDKSKLVLVDVQVRGKNGVFTRKQWKTPAEAEELRKKGMIQDNPDEKKNQEDEQTQLSPEEIKKQKAYKQVIHDLRKLDFEDITTNEEFVENNLENIETLGWDYDLDKLEEAWRDAKYSMDTKCKLQDVQDCLDTIRNNIPENIIEGWFRSADSGYKRKLENIVLQNPELRNAGLNLAYYNYMEETYTDEGHKKSFEEFLNTPLEVYRGKDEENIINNDTVISFSMNKQVAEHFGSNIITLRVKPINTLGCFMKNTESELLVRTKTVKELKQAYSERNSKV